MVMEYKHRYCCTIYTLPVYKDSKENSNLFFESELVLVEYAYSFAPLVRITEDAKFIYQLFIRDLYEEKFYRATSSIKPLLPEDFGITDYENNDVIEKFKQWRKDGDGI